MIRLKPLFLMSSLVMTFTGVSPESHRVISFEEEIRFKEIKLETLKSKIKVEIAELKYKDINN
jgi:hypothetical protein